MCRLSIIALLSLVLAVPVLRGDDAILIEAEAFSDHGGWKLDTQFIETMGSPYLIAHGLGRPVEDAVTRIEVPEAGKWHLWVRTKDWVARWDAPGRPGRFQVLLDGEAVPTEFGAEGSAWHWQGAGAFELPAGEVEVRLRDLTGFNGRCDALYLSRSEEAPDNSSDILPAWRREALGIEVDPIPGEFDIVFVGGGYAGSCGAISAARMGLKVALIQNRDVLGGNGSSEIRVWAKGNTPGGLYPVGDIVREFEDHAEKSPGTYEEFEDDKKEEIVRNEPNISLFLGHHAYEVVMDGNRIAAVRALETRTGRIREFSATYFCDATGHGYIGIKAGADRLMTEKGRLGMSNMWTWQFADGPRTFPETPWALDLAEGEFPYPRRFHAEWFWESGFDKHPLDDLEQIRDWNLRANFGAWNAMKNRGAYARSDPSGRAHADAELTWMAYIGGTRETLQLLGDVILSEEDIVSKKAFPDGCVLTTWSIDLHYPNEQYLGNYAHNPFIARAEHGKGVDRLAGYPVPYRCFYSRNIENLFMAGRNVSVTRKALGTIRVMKTGGMMGVVVGKAAAVARAHDTDPRGVYERYLPELIELLKLPGNMRRPDLDSPFAADPALPKFEAISPVKAAGGIETSSLGGLVVDDEEAELSGGWKQGRGLPGFVNLGYRYSSDRDAAASFDFTVPEAGVYDIRLNWSPHENRSSSTTVRVVSGGETIREVVVNQREAPLLRQGFHSLGRQEFAEGDAVSVQILGRGADGNVHADAVQLLKR